MSSGGDLVRVVGAAQRARKALQERDARIRAAHKAGHSLRAIANAAGMSHTAIANLLSR